MEGKINRQFSIFNFQFLFIWLLVIGFLIYSRFINLGWGLPYPMHPDEGNMANAVRQLNCKFPISNFQNCFNPHFFAYGQLTLYLGYLIVYLLKFFDGDLGFPISVQEATISLRILSAIASIINVFVLVKIIELISNIKNQILKINIKYQKLLIILILIFSPYAIQLAHFGTTESLLMLFYSLIIYLSMLMFERRTTDVVVWLGLISGMAIAAKVSSIIFIIVPLITILFSQSSWVRYKKLVKFIMFAIIFVLLFSPHNFINFKDFISSINYESDVALGKSLVFYTRQFVNTKSFYFQLEKIFPYALGWSTFILGGMGLIGLSWKDKKINLLRLAFLIYFIPSAMIYAKWSRFMAPILPLISIFSILLLLKIKDFLFNNDWINSKFRIQNSKFQVKSQKFFTFYFLILFLTFAFLLLICITPGIAYLSVYQNHDIRFQASDWIYENIPNNSYILSETANVVDIPITDQKSNIKNQKAIEKFYQVISFNFYDLDQSQELQLELINHLKKADYIFVPSRRLFVNHPKSKYPILYKYYEDLFSGKLGFEKVAEFNSHPKIKLLNRMFLELPDEQAEETWTVFDHPVIRIYKKVK